MIAKKRAFASFMQATLIGLLGFSFVLIAQQGSREVYRWGVLLLVVSTLLQMAFGNIPSNTGFLRSLIYLGIALVLIGGIVVLSISLVPSLLNLGQQ